MSDGVVEETDIYRDSSSAYLRLLKAYRKNPHAALKSVSWVKFQVMGDNFSACGEADMESFVKLMCSGEKWQIKLLTGFIENNPSLHKAVKEKDWNEMAKNYNGPSYKTGGFKYAVQHALTRHGIPRGVS